MAIKVAMALIVTFASIPSLGAVPQSLRLTYRYQQSFVVQANAGQELDLNYIRRLSELAHSELKMSVADFIPTNLSPDASESKLARQIIGHSLEKWLSSSETAEAFGEAVAAIEKPLSQSVAVTDSAGVQHKIGFNVKAARAIASINYTGFVDATLAYQVTSNTVALQVNRKLTQNQKVVLNQTINSGESRHVIAWQMDF